MRIKSHHVFVGLAALAFVGSQIPSSWTENAGFVPMIGFVVLFGLFWILAIWAVLRVLYHSFFVKGWPRKPWVYTLLGALLLAATYMMPPLFSSDNRPISLKAYAEGVAGCGETLKLYDDGTFKYHSVCFGTSTSKGSYHWSGDTIRFHEVKLGVSKSLFPEYGWLSEDSSLVWVPFVNDSVEGRLLYMKVTGGSLLEE